MRAILAPLLLPLLVASTAEARLPVDVVPRHYAITLAPDLPSGKFSGSEVITVDVKHEVRQVVLHAVEMEISSASLTLGGKTVAATVSYDAKEQTATLALKEPAGPGEATVALEFHALLNDKLRGLYRARDDAGRLFAVTQFEATDARRAFPCFDEPAYKARFQLTAIVDDKLAAISNGAVAKETHLTDGRKRVEFTETLPISSYLVALAVGPFTPRSAKAGAIPITVWAPTGREHLSAYALEAATKIVPAFERYFGVPYPFGKLDLIAAPEFQFGAMENVGAIVFKESLLLVDEKQAAPRARQAVVEVLAHEVAHQWFGDLVTMAWWDDVWLNESFATWGEKRIVGELYPEWRIWRDFAVGRGGPLGIDELTDAHPIRQAMLTSGSEEPESSPTIIYGKGAAVLRMIERYLGEETFRKGLGRYFEEHKFGNTRAADFFAALSAASGKPVDALAAAWIERAGHPVVTLKAFPGPKVTVVKLSQERFFASGKKSDEIWPVPVCLRWKWSGGQGEKCVLLEGTRTSVKIDAPGVTWVLGNAGAAGFYRVQYDRATLWRLLKTAFGDLPDGDVPQWIRDKTPRGPLPLFPEELVALLDDYWALVAAGREPLASWGVAVMASVGEGRQPDLAVLQQIAGAFEKIDRYLVEPAQRAQLESWAFHVFGGPIGEMKLGVTPRPGDDEETLRLRALSFDKLGTVAHRPEILKMAREMMAKPAGAVDGSMIDAVVAVATPEGDGALFDSLLARLKQSITPEEHDRIVNALGRFEAAPLVARALDLTLTDALRKEEVDRPIRAAMGRPASSEAALAFFAAHVDELAKRMSPYGMIRLVMGTATLCGDEQAKRVDEILAAHPQPRIKLMQSLAVEAVHLCGAMRRHAGADVAKWLAPKSAKAKAAIN